MNPYWNELVQKLDPYVPGEQPKDKSYVKLNTNENPYPPSPVVLEAMQTAVDERLRLYPDPNCDELREKIAEHFQLSTDQIFVGNGSDEVLAFSFMSFFSPEKPVYFADITYSFYSVYTNLCRLQPKLIPLDDFFQIPIAAFCVPNGGVVIPNPNAPTGQLLSLTEVQTVLEANPNSVVIIDEAYIQFGGESAVSLIKDYPNLLVVQTLSKFSSLAGIRVGYAIGHPDLIEGLNRVKNSFNSYTIDRIALAGAIAAFEEHAYFEKMAKKIIATRESTVSQLKELGFTIVPSKANFIFISHPEIQAETIFQQLKEHGILVRYFHKPRISNYLRVTIGTEAEMEQFLTVVNEILSK